MINQEVDFDSRLEKAKQKAKKIYEGDIENEGDVDLFFRMVISEYYNIPIFSDYFEKRTLDDLLFEVQIIRLRRQTPEEKAKEFVEAPEHKEEIDNLFKDFMEEDKWEEASPPENTQDLDQEIEKFMNTGKFKDE